MRIYRNFHYICYDPGTGAVFYIWSDKKENLETDADFFLAGSEGCEEYSADFYSDRNYDRSVESEWFHCIYCLLCSGNMRTVDHAAGIISFGTAATMGVICMTMAKSMNVSDVLAGGAILAGIYFGDRCSPVSTSALLVSELTKTDLYENLKGMAKAAIVPFVISCTVYWTLGLRTHIGTADGEIRTVLGEFYHLSAWTLLPVAVVLVFSAMRVNVKRTLAASALCGIFVAVLIQKYPVPKLPALCVSGFQPDDMQINRLMGGGGILSNMKVIAIVGISSCYSGIFKGTDFLHGIKDLIRKLNSKITPFGTTLLTSVVTAAVSCNQTLSIMLTNQLCGENNPDKKEFALSLENSAVVVAPLLPWSIASAVPLAFIGAPTMSVCAAIYLYLLPIWYFISVNFRRKKK